MFDIQVFWQKLQKEKRNLVNILDQEVLLTFEDLETQLKKNKQEYVSFQIQVTKKFFKTHHQPVNHETYIWDGKSMTIYNQMYDKLFNKLGATTIVQKKKVLSLHKGVVERKGIMNYTAPPGIALRNLLSIVAIIGAVVVGFAWGYLTLTSPHNTEVVGTDNSKSIVGQSNTSSAFRTTQDGEVLDYTGYTIENQTKVKRITVNKSYQNEVYVLCNVLGSKQTYIKDYRTEKSSSAYIPDYTTIDCKVDGVATSLDIEGDTEYDRLRSGTVAQVAQLTDLKKQAANIVAIGSLTTVEDNQKLESFATQVKTLQLQIGYDTLSATNADYINMRAMDLGFERPIFMISTVKTIVSKEWVAIRSVGSVILVGVTGLFALYFGYIYYTFVQESKKILSK
jgi:hypothetical protein